MQCAFSAWPGDNEDLLGRAAAEDTTSYGASRVYTLPKNGQYVNHKPRLGHTRHDTSVAKREYQRC